MAEAGPEREPGGSDPLRPDATIDDIQARVAHLSAAESTAAPAPAPETAADTGPAKSRRRGLLAGVGGAGAIGIGIVIVLATSLDGLSDAEQSARLQELVTHGASRLDDAALVSWTRLDTKAHLATDVKTCATIARGWFVQGSDHATVGTAVSHSYDALSIEDLGAVIDLDLKALEAEQAGSPAMRSVSDAVIAPVLDGVYAGVGTADRQTIDGLSSGATATDDAACSALCGIEAAAAALPADQFASWAVWLSTP
jgi:hypothetical protein